ncbi:unnamed protein product [Chrysodeixis includens]|uniref:Uncharacterized protein n=1 Tax=Chrysodeixis includens TaxID=689277 RepID=A0A9N8KYH0_CHRIL|nr:unnamed protein product [Chrysodeixis includens]
MPDSPWRPGHTVRHRTAPHYSAPHWRPHEQCGVAIFLRRRCGTATGLAWLPQLRTVYNKQLSGAAAAPHYLHPSPPRLPRAVVRCACGATPIISLARVSSMVSCQWNQHVSINRSHQGGHDLNLSESPLAYL